MTTAEAARQADEIVNGGRELAADEPRQEIAKVILAAAVAEQQRCARVARDRAAHHRDHCPPTCRCADGWHIATAILEPVRGRILGQARGQDALIA